MDRYKLTRRIAILGIGANVLLTAFKLTAGFASGSRSMIADGFNSAQDVFASAVTYVGNLIASKPEDKNHPYGHGKAEYIFSMIISLSLLLAGTQIFSSSASSILNRQEFEFSWHLVYIAIGTIIIKLWLFLYTRRAGRMMENLLVTANSADHRNDVFVTMGTLTGIILGTYGFYWADGAVGIGISVWIILTGLRIFASAYHVLMDTNIDQVLLQKITSIAEEVPGVDHIDSITSKPIGVGYILIVKVSVNGSMTVAEGHSVAARIKEKLKGCNFCRVEEVVVHVNPV